MRSRTHGLSAADRYEDAERRFQALFDVIDLDGVVDRRPDPVGAQELNRSGGLGCEPRAVPRLAEQHLDVADPADREPGLGDRLEVRRDAVGRSRFVRLGGVNL